MLLEDEAHVIQWLSQYGALPKTQLLRMLQKTPAIAEKILSRMKRELQIADVGDGYYLGLDPLSQPDQKTVLAVWVLLRFIDFVEPLAHYPASFPSQLFFLKENTGYEIVVLYEGEGNLLRLLQPQEDLKYIIVVPRIAMAQDLRLPRAPCLFATVEFQGLEEPEVLFYSEETIHNGMGPDDYHLVVYDSNSGTLMASVYDKSTETLGTYTVHKSARDGAAVMMALFPVLVSDDEFKDTCSKYHDQYTAGFPDLNVASEYMGILCDNAYRRIKDDGCPAHIKVNLDRSGNIMRVGQAQLDSGALSPARVVAGEFTIFAKTGAVTYKKAAAIVDPLDFVGKYRLHPRTLSPLEQLQVPKLPSWYIIPQEIVQICRHAQETTGKPTQMRNFLLRGPAGTGKTMGAKAVAAGLGLPYKKYTCNANTEIYDLLGQLFPDSAASSTGDAELDRENEELKAMGGPSYANVAKLMNLPDLDDLDYDPAGVYQALTGLEKDDATAQDCMALILDRVTAKVQALSRREQSSHVTGGQTFTYTQTDFLEALKNGYVIELQEPTTIAQPGVMDGVTDEMKENFYNAVLPLFHAGGSKVG